MENSDDLYELIKSLDKQEKRYFRLESGRPGDPEQNQYLVLFDALDSLKVYDEKLLRKKLKGEKFLGRLSAVKNYLYNSILTSQASYHAGKSIGRILDEYVRNISVLLQKNLYAQCRKLIVKAKALAAQHEHFTRWLDLLEMEKNIHAMRRFSETSDEEMTAIYEEEKRILEKIANTKKYYNKNARLVMFLHQKGLRLQGGDHEELAKILGDDFNDETHALSYDSRLYFYNANTAFGQATGNLAHSYEAAKRFIEFIESRPERLKENASRLVTGLNNFMVICASLKGKEGSIADAIAKMGEIAQHKHFQGDDIQLKIFLARYTNESLLCISTSHFEKAPEIAEAIDRGLERFGQSVNRNDRLMLCYYLAYLFFGSGDYSNALKWNNRILHHFEPNVREDMQCYSRLLNLIIHYEKGNVDLLEYELKSTYRFLSRRKRMFRFETVMLEFIRKNLSQPLTKKEITVQFQVLCDELTELFKDPQEKKMEEFFDFISWLKSKIEARPFAEVRSVREANYREK